MNDFPDQPSHSELDSTLIPAATAVLLRDSDEGLQTLMLRRNSKITFGGMWVFPGGRVDEAELDTQDVEGSARRAAVRESEEETGLVVPATDLVTWSYWIPPKMASIPTKGKRRRFSTWFFVAPAPANEVLIDEGEILEHRWLRPQEALDQRDNRQIELVPPTWVTLHQLSAHSNVSSVMEWANDNTSETFVTKALGGKPLVVAWHGDASYSNGDILTPGPRHRLVLDPAGWAYERTP